MKKQQLKIKLKKILIRYSGVLEKLTECEKEIKKLRSDIELIIQEDLNLEIFGFLCFSLRKDFGFLCFSLRKDSLDKLNNVDLLDLPKSRMLVDIALEKLSKKSKRS